MRNLSLSLSREREGGNNKRKEKLAVLGGIRSVSNATERNEKRALAGPGPLHRYPCGFVYFKLDSLFKSDCPPWPRWLTARKVQTSVHLPMGPWVGLDAGTKRRKGEGEGKGRGAGPVSARWRARPRNFSVVFRGPWSSGPEMKAEPPLNAAAGLRSKIPSPLPVHPKAKNVRLYMYAPRRAATSRHFSPSTFRPLLDPTLETHAIFSFFSLFLFSSFRPPPPLYYLLFHSLSLPLSFPTSFSLELSGRFSGIRLEPPFLSPRSSYLLLVALSLHLLFPPCFLLRCLPLGRFRGKAGPRRSTPSTPRTRRSIGIRGPAARGPRSRSLVRSPGRSGPLSARLEPVAYASVRLCRPSSFSFSSNFLSPPVRRFNGPMRERISMISCSLAEERVSFGEEG